MDETPMTPAPGPSSPETRTGAQLLRDGETLSAHHMAAVKEELGRVIGFKWEQFDVLSVDASEAVLEIDGLTYTLALNDDDGFVEDNRSVNYEWRSTSYDNWIADSKLYNVHPDREEHMSIVRIQSDTPRFRGYAIVGNRWPGYDGMTGTATYDGDVNARIDVYEGGATSIWSPDHLYSYNGQLVANFDAGTISGQFTDWRADLSDEEDDEDIDMIATLSAARITADGFTGTFSLSGPDAEDFEVNASYEGSFYGPEAQNVAGVITGTYTETDEIPGQMIGYFTAEEHSE